MFKTLIRTLVFVGTVGGLGYGVYTTTWSLAIFCILAGSLVELINIRDLIENAADKDVRLHDINVFKQD